MKGSLFLLCSQSMMLSQHCYFSCGAEPRQTHPATCRGFFAQKHELWLGADLLLTLQQEQSEPRFAIKPAASAPWTSHNILGWKVFLWGKDGSGAAGSVPSLKRVHRACAGQAARPLRLHLSVSIAMGGREEVFL